MGNKISLATHKVFEKDLEYLSTVVNAILDKNNIFRNNDYNFLSKDVCEKHTLVLEDELSKHLKVSLQTVGTSLYLIPNNETNQKQTIKGTKFTKKEICEKISNHYMKILYILSLIKYVYDIENHGDYSVAGIIFRNIKVVDDIMAINYCNMQQKDYSQKTQNFKIDFGTLEGMSFLIDYVLSKDETKTFIDVIRSVLSRSPRGIVRQQTCALLKNKKLNKQDIDKVEDLYQKRYGTKLECPLNNEKIDKNNEALVINENVSIKRPNLHMKVEKDNPIFLKEFCYSVKEIVIMMNKSSNKKVVEAFKQMQNNYKVNLKSIESLINRLVVKKGQVYELRDITKYELDNVIYDVKSTVKIFYIQSIMDYQHLLDIAKTIQNIEVNK
jgi:predicted transcriptional regulator